jgi:hypothetical protein
MKLLHGLEEENVTQANTLNYGDWNMTLPASSEDKLKLLDALKEISASMTRVEAERDLIKNVKNDICDDLQLNRKVLNKLARTYHKGNYSEEVEMHKDFEELYETVTKKAS